MTGLWNGAMACLGVVVAFGTFWCIGRLVPGRRFWEYPLIGWAIVYLMSVVCALMGLHSLKYVLMGSAMLAAISLLWRPPVLTRHAALPWIIAALPFLALSVYLPPVFVDSYSHWLPNSSYIYQLGSFPKAPLGDFMSLHPTYPNALPLVIYFSSVVTGQFAELAGNVLNAVLMLLAMGCIWQLLRESTPPAGSAHAELRTSRYLLVAAAFCIAIPLNPAIEMQYYWSAIADPALAVLAFLTIAESSRYVTREGPDAESKTSLFLLFLIGCLASGLKPNAWVIFGGIAASLGFVALVQRARWRRWLPAAAVIVVGTLLSSLLWKVYLTRHLPIPDQFVIRPFDKWSFELWDELLLAMLQILKMRTIYSTVVLATMAVGFATLLRPRLVPNATLRLMIGIASVSMALHVASLFAAYLGTGFEDWMITTASSFPRYTTQVGYAVCTAGLLVGAAWVLPFISRQLAEVSPKRVATVCAVGCAAAFAILTVRPTLALESLAQERMQHREIALAVAKSLKPGDRVVAAGSKWTINYLNYIVWTQVPAEERPHLLGDLMFYSTVDDCDAGETLSHWLADPAVDAVLLINAPGYAQRCARNPAPHQIWRRPVGRWQPLELRLAEAR